MPLFISFFGAGAAADKIMEPFYLACSAGQQRKL